MDLKELLENFELLDDWEDRYRYIIELGGSLPSLPEAEHTDENKVDGCTSQVWFKPNVTGNVFSFEADSDSSIVKGLIAILHVLFSGKTKKEAKTVDIDDVFHRLGLDANLSPTRRNGFFSIVERIKRETTRMKD